MGLPGFGFGTGDKGTGDKGTGDKGKEKGGESSGFGLPGFGFGTGDKGTGTGASMGPATSVIGSSITGISMPGASTTPTGTLGTPDPSSITETITEDNTMKYINYFFENPKSTSLFSGISSEIFILIMAVIMIISIILILLQKYSGLLDFLIVVYILFSGYYLYKLDFTTFVTLSAIMLVIIIIIISVFSNELTKFIAPLFIFASFMLLIVFPMIVLWLVSLYKLGYKKLIEKTYFNTIFSSLFSIEITAILILLFMYKKYYSFLLLISLFVSTVFVIMNNFSIYSFLIIFLIIMLILILAKCDLSLKTIYTPTDQKIVSDIFIILFFVILIILIVVFLSFKSFNELKTSTKEDNLASAGKLFSQISNVFYIIVYTIFIILFFTFMPNNILNTYSKVILPITILIGAFAFYKSYKSHSTKDEFNVKYDRIKTIILLFCLIAIYIIFYSIDPGGYIQQYFGSVSVIAIIIAVFAFLYLIVIFTLSNEREKAEKSKNLLSQFSKTSSVGGLLFLLFIIAITITIIYYPNGFFSDSNKTTIAGPAIIMILLICIFWSIMLIQNLFSDKTGTKEPPTILSLFQKSLMVLFAIVIGILTIVWLVYNLQNLSNSSSIFSFIINVIIMLIVLNLIYKTIYVKIPDDKIGSKKNAFFSLIINIVFYIPCLFGDLFEGVGNMLFSIGATNAKTSELTKVTSSSVMMLIIAIVLIIGYFGFPFIINKLTLQGGRLLVDNPVYTNVPYLLGTYEELNGSTNYDYQYAISFWFFLDSTQQTGGTAYTSLLNFGNKPNVLYREDNNTLLITMEDAESKTNKTINSMNDYDADNKRILYKNDEVLLQKWNNIIINYSGGIMDIFLNNELVKSNVGVVPYYTIDNLTIGQDDGIKGGICNVVYYTHPLNKTNMYFLYNMVKDKNPPVLNQSNETILKQDWQIASSSVTSVSTPAINQATTSISNNATNINNQIKK